MEMTELHFKTKGGAQPQGKPRVYFTCHPADFERCFEKLCSDLFAAADCAVYYTADMAGRLPEDTREFDLERMNLFVIPVSLKLLTEPNRAMDEDFPFARSRSIPVLPILLETDLDALYSRENRFGTLQYLDPLTRDDSAIPYEEKLKKYLESVLVSSETARRIHDAFDAHIFLSYRKKDRKYANELMKLIHDDPICQNIAVWFDEFLNPSESWVDGIRAAMDNSKLFALLVTPSLLERNDLGQPNYIQDKEYPMARAAGMPLLPAELAATDKAALAANFPGLPSPLDMASETERERFLNRLRDMADRDAAFDAEHAYLIGLAYLLGLEVETNRGRALALLTAAAEAEHAGAMRKLRDMYLQGDGVPLDYQTAAGWAEKLVDLLWRTRGEEDEETLEACLELSACCTKAGMAEKAGSLLGKVYEQRLETLGEADPATLRALSAAASAYAALGQYDNALPCYYRVYDWRCFFLGKEHPDSILALCNYAEALDVADDASRNGSMQAIRVHSIQLLGNELFQAIAKVMQEHGKWAPGRTSTRQMEARPLLEEAYARSRRVFGEEDPVTLHALSALAENRGRDAGAMGGDREELEKVIALQERIYALRRKVSGPKHPDTVSALLDLGWTYATTGTPWKGLPMIKSAYDLYRGVLGKLHPNTLGALCDLANACSECRQYAKFLLLTLKCRWLCLRAGLKYPKQG